MALPLGVTPVAIRRTSYYHWVLRQLPASVTRDTNESYGYRHWVLRCIPLDVTASANGCYAFSFFHSQYEITYTLPPTTYSLLEEGVGEVGRGAL